MQHISYLLINKIVCGTTVNKDNHLIMPDLAVIHMVLEVDHPVRAWKEISGSVGSLATGSSTSSSVSSSLFVLELPSSSKS